MCMCFFFKETATTEIYTLSLHDALPISPNIRLVTIKDFRALCSDRNITVLKEGYITLTGNRSARPIRMWPNFRASSAMFLLAAPARS